MVKRSKGISANISDLQNYTKHPKYRELVIKELLAGNITKKQATTKLGLSVKQISRLRDSYLNKGQEAFKHGNIGKANSNRIDPLVEQTVVKLYKECYEPHGFNFTHFSEYIKYVDHTAMRELYAATGGAVISNKTIYNILRRNGIESPKAKRVVRLANPHPRRPRRSSMGELVQLDASVHVWVQGSAKLQLHIAIDDATSVILGACFDYQETTATYFKVVHQIITNPDYGVPKCFYTDRRATFVFNRGEEANKKARIQFQTACNRLGIGIITTSSSQAKGRVERSFRTHQDRLVSELSKAGIHDICGANDYLNSYLKRHNKKYGVVPRNSQSSFRTLTTNELKELNTILATRHTRKILAGNVISFNNKQYLPVDKSGRTIPLPEKTIVNVVSAFDGSLKIDYLGQIFNLKFIAEGRASATTPIDKHPWRGTF